MTQTPKINLLDQKGKKIRILVTVARFYIFTCRCLYKSENLESYPTHAFDTELQINPCKLAWSKVNFPSKSSDILELWSTKATELKNLINESTSLKMMFWFWYFEFQFVKLFLRLSKKPSCNFEVVPDCVWCHSLVKGCSWQYTR